MQHSCKILAHEQRSKTLWQLTLEAKDLAALVKPGQFVHLLIPGFEEHVLRRPFSVYKVNKDTGCISIIYRVVGKGTTRMTTLSVGCEIDLLGPIGTGWNLPNRVSRVLIVGAGVGAAPVFELAAQAKNQGIETSVVLGAQTQSELIFEDDYRALGIDLTCATDDGSYGFSGFCTVPTKQLIDQAKEEGFPFDYCAVCGPYPVMKIVAGLCVDQGVLCQVSMEKRMACGIGACLSCVLDTKEGKRRSCVDGPVFDACEVEW